MRARLGPSIIAKRSTYFLPVKDCWLKRKKKPLGKYQPIWHGPLLLPAHATLAVGGTQRMRTSTQ